MVIDFSICGGELTIEKKIFIREMLKADSPMKKLLNFNLEDSGKKRSLKIDKTGKQKVVIDFNFVDNVPVGDVFQNLIKELKKEYRGDIRGEITLSSTGYFYQMIITLNLDSDDDEVKMIL